MNKAQIEHARESAVFDFLTENEGSVLVAQTTNTAVLRTGGLTQDQLKFHLIACIVSFGLWIPIFAIVCLLRHPRGWILKVDQVTGEVEIREL
jgi:hypothetical protein